MQNLFLGIFCLLMLGFYSTGQDAQFFQTDYEILAPAELNLIYNMKATQDSTFLDGVISEKMILAIGGGFSSYQNLNSLMGLRELRALSQNNFENFRTLAPEITRRFPSRIRHSVFKHYNEKKLVTNDNVFVDRYEYTEPMNGFLWHITGNEKSFMGYKVLEATTTYGCRNWVAWFTPDIPISDGPYKFHGLPGLIVKVADTKNHYVFELESVDIKDLTVGNVDVEISANRIKTTLAEFIRMRNNFTKDAGNIVAMHSSNPEIRARASANAARRNNFIELCAD
jgi:GLPGLI family protein